MGLQRRLGRLEGIAAARAAMKEEEARRGPLVTVDPEEFAREFDEIFAGCSEEEMAAIVAEWVFPPLEAYG